jgi:hypothetical protein
MRTSGKRHFRNISQQMAERRAIDLSGVVVQVIPEQKVALVAIQDGKKNGNTVYIRCFFCEGVQSPPTEVKPGMAVRLERDHGITGRMRIAGIGQTVPTGVAIASPAAEDAVLGFRGYALPEY